MGRFSQLETQPGPAVAGPPPTTSVEARPTAPATGDAPPAPAPAPAAREAVPAPAAPPSLEALPPAEADVTLGDADWAYYSGDFERALRLYSRVIQMDATRIAPWVGQVYSLLRRRQGGEALTWANRALEMFPEHPILLSARAVAYASNGMIKRALGASDYALSRGSSREAWLARGEVLLAAGRTNALACFDKALEGGHAEDWKTLMHIGMVLADHRKHSSAIEYLQRAVQLRTDNPHLWYRIGETAIRLGWRERAMQAYERAHQLDPANQVFKRAWDAAKAIGPIGRLFLRLWGG